MDNLIGKKFNYLTIIEGPIYKIQKNNKKRKFYKCQCDCGNIKEVRYDGLTSGTTKSCGCFKNSILINSNFQKRVDLTGQKFGKVTAIKPTEERKDGRVVWECLCDCGNIVYINSHDLQQGKKNSCGCMKSKGEYIIEELLKKYNIPFEAQKSFDTCRFPDTGYLAKFDFWVKEKYLIEYDGEQHFYFKNSSSTWNTEENQKKVKEHDNFKNCWCKENNIPLIRIPYTKLEEISIEDLMLEECLNELGIAAAG